MLPYHKSQERNELSRKISCSIVSMFQKVWEEPVRISVSLGKELTSLLFRTCYKINVILIPSVK